MAEHDIKGDKLQINKILSREQVRIVLENILSYSEEFELDELDIVYRKYLDLRLAEFGATYIGTFANLAAIEAYTEDNDVNEGSYAFVESGSELTVYFYTGTEWKPISGGGGGGLPTNILDALQGTGGTPGNANRYVTAEGLATVLASLDFPSGERVISANLVISSPTAGTITATWVDDQNDTNTVTAAPLTFSGAPASSNFRFDNVLGNDDGTVSVQTGTPATSNPIIPTAPAGSLILSTVLWNDAGVGEVVPPTIANVWSILRFSTQVAPGTQTLYAKIWEGPLSANDHFAFQLLYHGPREVTNFQGDGTGKLKVSWTCNPDLTIQAGTVQIETESNAAPGDFRLIRIAGNRAALYHRSRIFWGRIQYRVAYHSSAIALADFGGGSYAAAPTALQTFDSRIGPNFTPSTGSILFDGYNKYGFTTALTGNITFGITGAVETVMVKIRHNAAVAPTFSAPGGVTLVREGGNYVVNVNNYIYAICHMNDTGTVNAISYTINQNQV